jgi:hypothetical protein
MTMKARPLGTFYPGEEKPALREFKENPLSSAISS